ncbi:hypothetical protein [Actinophytocola sediminis]
MLTFTALRPERNQDERHAELWRGPSGDNQSLQQRLWVQLLPLCAARAVRSQSTIGMPGYFPDAVPGDRWTTTDPGAFQEIATLLARLTLPSGVSGEMS